MLNNWLLSVARTMSENGSEDNTENIEVEVEQLFRKYTGPSTSSIELPKDQWSSLIISKTGLKDSSKRSLRELGLLPSESEAICATDIPISDSDVFRHPYYSYPAVLDPGIKEALLEPDSPRPPYPGDGYQLYMDLCEEFNVCPVRLFYSNLLNSEINLKFYCPNSQNVKIMAMALQNNEHVKRLDLTECYLDQDACYHLGEMIKTNRTLEALILDRCKIQAAGLLRIKFGMSINNSIKTLNLARNDLTDIGGEVFANIIYSGARLNVVNLSNNGLGVMTARALCESISFTNYFTHLDLSSNTFVPAESIVKFLKALAFTGDKLVELDLSFSALDKIRVAEALAEVTLLPKLKVLNLSDNRFSDDSAAPLVSNLLKSKLRTYNLSNNLFTPVGACSILQMLTLPRVKLQQLYLDNICVNRNFIRVLADIRKMKSRKNFIVTFDRVLHDWEAIGDDPRNLILRCGEYMGKTKKKDVPLFLLSLSCVADNIRPKELVVMMKHQKMTVNDDWVDGLIQAFPGPLVDKKPTVDAKKMREYIKRIWPDMKLPPNWKPPVMIRVEVKNNKKINKST